MKLALAVPIILQAALVTALDVPVYGKIKLTFATPEPTSVSLNVPHAASKRDAWGYGPFHWGGWNYPAPSNGGWPKSTAVYGGVPQSQAAATTTSVAAVTPTISQTGVVPSTYLQTTAVVSSYSTSCQATETRGWWFWQYTLIYPSSCPASTTYTTVLPRTTFVTVTPSVLPASITVSSKPVSSAVAPPVYISSSASTHVTVITFSSIVTVSHNNTTATSIRRTTRTSTVIVLTTVPAYTTNARNAISSATTIDAVSSASASVSDQATNPVIPAYRIPVSDAPTRDPSASATHSEATPSAFLNSATSVLGAEASVAIGQESQTSTISTPVAYGDAKISSVRASSSQNVSHADISSSMTFPSAGLSSSSDGQTLTIISSSQASATKEVLSSPPGYRSASAYTARSVELSLTAVRSSTAAGKASSEVPLSQPTAPSGAGDTASVSVSLVSSTTVSTSASSQSNPESSSSANSLISPVGSAASIKPSSYNSKSNALPPYYVPRPSVTSSSAAVFSEASGAASSVSSSYWLASTASEISIVSTSLTIAFSYAAGPASASLASALRSGSLPASYAVPSARTTTSAAQNRSSIASGGIPSYANSVVSSAVTVSTGSIPAILPYESPPSTNSRPVSISQTEHTPTSASSSTEGGRSLTASASCMSKPSNIHTKSRTRAQHSIGRCNGSTGASSSIGASSTYVVAPATASISSAAAARSSGKAISSGSPSKSTTLSQSSLQASASISALTNAYRSASMLGTTDLPSRVYGTGQISSLITQSRSMLSGYVSTAIASSTGRSTLPSSSGVLVSPVKYSLSNAVSVSVLSKPSNIHTKSRTRAGHSIGRCNASSCSSTATGSVRQSRPFSSSGISIGPVSYSASPSRVSSSNISSVRLPSTGVTSAARSSVGSSLRPVSSSAKTSSSTSSLVSASCLSKPSNAHTKSRTRAAHSIGHCSAGSGTSTGTAISSGAIGSQGAFSSSVASSRASVSVATPSVSSSASSRQASTSQVFSQASRGTGYGVVRSSAPTAVSLASIPTSGVSISPPAYGAKYPSSAAVSDRLVSSSVGSASRPESFTASASIEPGARSSSGAPSSVSRLATSAPSIALSRPPAYPQSGSQRPSFKPSSGASGSGWPDFPSWTISATAVSSKVSSSKVKPSTSTSAYVCATPTPDAKCTPCKDQPGSDPASYCGYTINDNYYDVVPTTCRTVEYNFTITNTTLAPDGYDRPVMLINGQMPGPQIEANWGDWIVVHITNQLQDNGTSLHFHGARMNGTNEMDGATSITQCPVAPGESYTYKFRATQYGTSWYHSHFGLQAYEGVFGPMVINGPQSAEYDYDAGVLTLQDWSHVPVMAMFDAAQTVGSFPEHGPRTMDTGLINGMNKGQYGGDHFTLPSEFVPGKRYLIRLVNTAIQATFKFYIDQHKFKVIAMDYTPIHPYEATIVTINPGQRYDIIVEADQVAKSYWIRADAQDTCTTNVKDSKDIKAVLNYAGAYLTEPWSTPWPYVDTCEDEKASDLVPILSLSAGALDESLSKTVVIGPGPQTPNLYKWQLDGTSFVSKWDDPTLLGIVDNRTITNKYTGNLQVQYDLGEWIYLLIQTPIPLTHPIHLHGHDFFVVGSGIGQYKQSDSLNLVNPPRRDTALIPSASGQGGYLVLAWKADNPGAWLAHCHIGWHAAMGFTLEIIEGSADEIASTVTNSCQVDDTCKAWNVYAAAKNVEDLGI